MGRLLTALCWFTLLATGYMTMSILILHPPRANYLQWMPMATLFVATSVATLTAIPSARGDWIRRAALGGGVAIAGLGAAWARATVTGQHFEGYALVLGYALVAQGALTVAVLVKWHRPYVS